MGCSANYKETVQAKIMILKLQRIGIRSSKEDALQEYLKLTGTNLQRNPIPDYVCNEDENKKDSKDNTQSSPLVKRSSVKVFKKSNESMKVVKSLKKTNKKISKFPKQRNSRYDNTVHSLRLNLNSNSRIIEIPKRLSQVPMVRSNQLSKKSRRNYNYNNESSSSSSSSSSFNSSFEEDHVEYPENLENDSYNNEHQKFEGKRISQPQGINRYQDFYDKNERIYFSKEKKKNSNNDDGYEHNVNEGNYYNPYDNRNKYARSNRQSMRGFRDKNYS